ncbi:hypothetical protein [Roseovarius sp. TM1035]|uniref:hypothetical protein n=1 Tax=Roseovarius sp. TM1035 TaxID=391613 RepID=UPI0012F4FA3E|nr:hypothetical protein [Roseovarius sp. TM1035]
MLHSSSASRVPGEGNSVIAQPAQHTVILPPLDGYQALSALFSGVLPPAKECVKVVDMTIHFT